MTVEYKGRGDPQRSLELLWRSKRGSTRGPKPSLTIEQISAAAIEIADLEGLHGVTMRRVAERLNVGAMSLYTYVPGKAELLDVMLDEVLGEPLLVDRGNGDNWRTRLEAHARAEWDLFHRHPWVLQVSEARSLLGPNEIALLEAGLQTISGLGLSGREMIAIVSLVSSYVRGAAQQAIDAARATEQTGISDTEWWAARAPILDEYFDPSLYPTVASIDIEGAFDPTSDSHEYHVQLSIDAFEFGIARVLDGIEAFIDKRKPNQNGTGIC